MINFLDSAKKQFEYYKMLGEKSFAQVDDKSLPESPGAESNSIAVIVQHLHGNMLSRWTDFLASDGEKEWRNRDMEFEDTIRERKDLLARWEEGWACLFAALNNLTDTDLERTIYIRNQGHTVVDAINRQLCHYAYHVSQIVYAAKLFKGKNWTSLSIPRNMSGTYNKEKFSQEKAIKHFTDEYLGDKRDGNAKEPGRGKS